jgi:hypothetical protein
VNTVGSWLDFLPLQRNCSRRHGRGVLIYYLWSRGG